MSLSKLNDFPTILLSGLESIIVLEYTVSSLIEYERAEKSILLRSDMVINGLDCGNEISVKQES